jgi:hypothetical protein
MMVKSITYVPRFAFVPKRGPALKKKKKTLVKYVQGHFD